jgi:hypothetical protein
MKIAKIENIEDRIKAMHDFCENKTSTLTAREYLTADVIKHSPFVSRNLVKRKIIASFLDTLSDEIELEELEDDFLAGVEFRASLTVMNTARSRPAGQSNEGKPEPWNGKYGARHTHIGQ